MKLEDPGKAKSGTELRTLRHLLTLWVDAFRIQDWDFCFTKGSCVLNAFLSRTAH